MVSQPMKPSGTKLFVVTEAPWNAKKDATTDDTGAIQQVLDTAANKDGGIIFMPAGEYAVKGNLTIPSGVELCGVSMYPDNFGGGPRGRSSHEQLDQFSLLSPS